ncbi:MULTISPECIES: hypothetical protein [Providencia]|uniref:hypothetical protein n=1 Tax=Providencia TaxID=586 RepID=UPI001BAB691F|nr:hypothetical protein [Providencia rettgeri]MBS0917701.1 hypothetical protein [Providencia rettgeri]
MDVRYKEINSEIRKYIKAIRAIHEHTLKDSVSLWVIFAAATFHGISNELLRIIAFSFGLYFYARIANSGDPSLLKKSEYENLQKIKKTLISNVKTLQNEKRKETFILRINSIHNKNGKIFERNKKSWFGIKKIPHVFIASYLFYMACFIDSVVSW